MRARPTSRGTGTSSTLWMCISCARRPTEARSKSILVVKMRSGKRGKTMPRFLLVLDDDHEYNQHVVERYSKSFAGVAVDGLYGPKSHRLN